MAQQKSEGRDKTKVRRKTNVTRGVERPAGVEAIPVEERTKQLHLFAETAEQPMKMGRRGKAERARSPSAKQAQPKSAHKDKPAAFVTMSEVIKRLSEAFSNVARNRGAPGPDGKSIAEMREHQEVWLPSLSAALEDGTYMPGDIRRVWIPKSGGGERGLGIPNVIDRVVQESVRLVLEPTYEQKFHESSHGFRPEKSAHTAIAEAVGYIEDGYEWTVDLDLEKFFDRVNHQRLMSRLAKSVNDKAVLVLIGRMLKAKVVLPNGVLIESEEGVPQGGPLSPLLSNIVLDELDQELSERGHRFVRYADDCNIYVRSERAGQRVMASVTQFIEGRLRLKVNASKSAVARTEERHFLGFRLRREPLDSQVEVLLSKRTQERINKRLQELIPRNWGGSMNSCIQKLNAYLLGWLSYFGICTAGAANSFGRVDAHARRRLRALQLRQWKRKRTIVRKLQSFGVSLKSAWNSVYDGHKSIWKMSHTSGVERALRNSYWDERGLFSTLKRFEKNREQVVAPAQLTLSLG